MGRRGIPAAVPPTNVAVTGTPATATVSWQQPAGVASYTIVRQEPTVAPMQVATLPASALTWSDLGVHPNSPYTYVVTAVYPDGSQGSAQGSVTTPAAVNPSGFKAAETTPGTVQLSWNSVTGPYPPSYYVLIGPGVPGGGTKVGLATSFTATGLPPGSQTWMVASYYDPTGVQGAAVSTPGTQFPTISVNVSAPAMSGHYLVSVTGLRAVQMSVDDILSRDGKGDEVFAAAFVRQYDRNTGQATMFTARQTMVYGDINGFSTSRVQAGSYQPLGGIRDGDAIPTGATVDRQDPQQDVVFPWRVWEGTLTDRSDALVISPSIWEVDGDASHFHSWVQQQTFLNNTLLSTPTVKWQIQNNAFSYATQGGAEAPGGIFATKAPTLAADAVLVGLGLPPLATLLSGSLDRHIGMVNGPNGAMLPNTVVVLTREIIEQALNQPAIGLTMVNGNLPIFFPKPGIMAIPFVDTPPGGFIKDRPAIYYMILQVERLP